MKADASRRGFLALAGGAAAVVSAAKADPRVAAILTQTATPDALSARIAESDLRFNRPAPRSEEGLPIGNGRMGGLVWTTPSSLHIQINRVDIYPSDSRSNSFVEAHGDPCGGCGFVDIALDGEPFGGDGFDEHLSVFDGYLTIRGRDVVVRLVALREPDVIAVAIEDRRAGHRTVRASLRALRYAPSHQDTDDARAGETSLRTRSHVAASRIQAFADAVALSQRFAEDEFHSSSAVILRFLDGTVATEVLNDTTAQLTRSVAPSSVLLIGSAAELAEDPEIVKRLKRAMDEVAQISLVARIEDGRVWWRRYWDTGSIAIRSADGVAQEIQRHYHYFLYLMASSSTGKLPPKFNGMLWNTGGDSRAWGAQHWYTNASCYYEALPAAGRFDIMDPFFDMHTAMIERCVRAAREQWGSQGLFIPETVYFDGPEPLPQPIAVEMRSLYLRQTPWAERSAAFEAAAETRHPYASAWNWKRPGQWRTGRFVEGDRGQGPYGPTSHIFAVSAKVAYLFWRRFEFTQDRSWLENRAYPMLRGAVEFYRHHPLVSVGEDGLFHIRDANNSEPVRGARDTNEDLSAMRGATAALIRAALVLGKDEKELPAWRDFLRRLAPLPTSHDPDALGGDRSKPAMMAAGRGPAVYANPLYLGPDPHSLPSWFFDLCGAETSDIGMRDLSRSTLERLLEAHSPASETWNGGLSKLGIAAATLGDAARVRILLAAQMLAKPADGVELASKWKPLRNRLNLGEGAQALSAQHLGRGAETLHLALLQSDPPAPGEAPLLRLAPACPPDWDAEFRLHARGGFVIDAEVRRGRTTRLEIQSAAGEPCRLRNPFDGSADLIRKGRPAQRLSGDLLEFATTRGETVALTPARSADPLDSEGRPK